MKVKIYQIDAFTDKVFSGNPAAVCPLDEWLDDSLLQNIAMENNLAETAFFVKQDTQYEIRWFTPKVEVDLCGHATLAAAHVLFTCENYPEHTIRFYSPRSGKLTVSKQEPFLALNFPTDLYKIVALTPDLTACFDIMPLQALKGKTDYVLIFADETQIRNMKPNLSLIAKLPGRGVIVTAKGDEVDFVSRFFAPQSGIDEDPVTGSAHTTLAPYWARALGKSSLTAVQISARKGFLQCKYMGHRVEIRGQAKLYMVGEIKVR